MRVIFCSFCLVLPESQLRKHNLNSGGCLKKKTLLLGRLPIDTGIADIIDFFKDVGQVVRVQLIVHPGFRTTKRCGFVKLASSNETEKVREIGLVYETII